MDAKLIERYGLDLSKWARARKRKQGYASVQYLRHGRFFVLIATAGEHDFFTQEKRFRDVRRVPLQCFGYSIGAYPRAGGAWPDFADSHLPPGEFDPEEANPLRRASPSKRIRDAGLSGWESMDEAPEDGTTASRIREVGWHPSVRIAPKMFKELKEKFAEAALRRTASELGGKGRSIALCPVRAGAQPMLHAPAVGQPPTQARGPPARPGRLRAPQAQARRRVPTVRPLP